MTDGWACLKFVNEEEGAHLRQFVPDNFKFPNETQKPRWFNSLSIQSGSIKSEVKRKGLINVARVVKIQYIVVLI